MPPLTSNCQQKNSLAASIDTFAARNLRALDFFRANQLPTKRAYGNMARKRPDPSGAKSLGGPPSNGTYVIFSPPFRLAGSPRVRSRRCCRSTKKTTTDTGAKRQRPGDRSRVPLCFRPQKAPANSGPIVIDAPFQS
nr:hypothetical protein [Pandoravirus massiliensis]